MDLTLPERYHADMGRTLTAEEIAQVKPTVTQIEDIVSRTCRVESNNERWRLGKA